MTIPSLGIVALGVLLIGSGSVAASPSAAAEDAPPATQATLPDRLPAFEELLRTHGAQLATMPSGQNPLALFTETIGMQAGLKDAAMTLAAKNLPAAMSKDLMLEQVKSAAIDMMRGLAAWHLARQARALNPSSDASLREATLKQAEAQADWLTRGMDHNHPLRRLLSALYRPQAADQPGMASVEQGSSHDTQTGLSMDAAAAETWAIETVHREWFRLHNWKDTIRQQRGLARLCGSWQWNIHNHQNHREEKTAVIFAPPETAAANTPAEIIVLGDAVYLRWETKAGMQEDSLLFTGEGQRLEGTFVNSAGGWGSITGKRTASCTKAAGEKATSPPRRHH